MQFKSLFRWQQNVKMMVAPRSGILQSQGVINKPPETPEAEAR